MTGTLREAVKCRYQKIGSEQHRRSRKKMAGTRVVEDLAEELAERWISFFAPKDWPGRLQLLQQVHEQLQEDLGDLDLYCSVSSAFIRKLIERLSHAPVASAAQAHVYANSDNEEHRRAASEWLEHHSQTVSMPKFARS